MEVGMTKRRLLSITSLVVVVGLLYSPNTVNGETRYISREEVKPAMEEFTKALGVKCDYCHLQKPKEGEAELSLEMQMDARTRFRVARAMIAMTAYANKKGGDQATCNTCHNGKAQPGPREIK
jgi:hypothetical protein